MKRGPALRLATELIEVISPYCEEAIIAGSIRRMADEVGDIEIVCRSLPLVNPTAFGGRPVVDMLDQALQGMMISREITDRVSADPARNTWGPRHRKFLLADGRGGWHNITVDMFIVSPPAEWGAILALRTGSADWNKLLMRKVLPYRHLRQKDGRLLDSRGVPIETPTEKSYFKALGLPHIHPKERTAMTLYQMMDKTEWQPYQAAGGTVEQQSLF